MKRKNKTSDQDNNYHVPSDVNSLIGVVDSIWDS